VSVQVDGVVSGANDVRFSYDPPQLSSISPRTGSFITPVISLHGKNFGTDSINAMLGSTACTATTWVSSSLVECTPAPVTVLISEKPLSVLAALSADGTEVASCARSEDCQFRYASTDNTAVASLDLYTVAGSVLVVHVVNASSFTKINVAGPLMLGGVLKAYFGNYRPSRAESFSILGADSVSGNFTEVIIADVPGATGTFSMTDGLKLRLRGCDDDGCSGHGSCDTSSGSCTCEAGYGGTNCDTACFYNTASGTWDCTCDSKLYV
jgi:hypothetical protein